LTQTISNAAAHNRSSLLWVLGVCAPYDLTLIGPCREAIASDLKA